MRGAIGARRVFTGTVAAVLALSATLAAVSSPQSAPQSAPQAPPVPAFPTTAELVELDVVVTDKAGAPARGLRREDFEVVEDGRPQPISHFAEVGGAAALETPTQQTPRDEAAAAPAAVRQTVAAGRTIVLVFDDLHLGAASLSAAKAATARFLSEQVAPRDDVGLVTTSGIRGVQQQVTRDRDALVRAVNLVMTHDHSARARFEHPYVSEHQAEQIDRFGELSAGNEAFELAVAQFMAEYELRRPEQAITMVRERVRSILEECALATRASLSVLEGTVRQLAGLPGRKIVVLVSEGFFLGRGTTHEASYDLRRITDAATRSGVVVYSLDALGLRLPTPGGDIAERFLNARLSVEVRSRVESGQDLARREGLDTVADETGGVSIRSGSISSGFRRILDDNEHYYLIAYEPVSPRRDRRFREIRVRLPGQRDLVVRTRKGYFEPGEAAKATPVSPKRAAADTGERFREALTSVVPHRGLPTAVSADFVDLPDRGPTVVVNVAVDTAPLVAGEDRPAEVALAGLVSDQKGASVEQFGRRLRLESPAAGRPAAGPIRFTRRMTLKPGLYQVRVAALGEGKGQTGSASQWIEVPDLAKGRLTLSSLFLELAQREGDSPAASAVVGVRGTRTNDAVRRVFPGGREVDAVFFVYNAGSGAAPAADLVARFQIRAGGVLLHEFEPRAIASPPGSEAARIRGGARLSLAGLRAGDYELRVVVESRREGTTAERAVGFSVE